jgi:hypothetical protein
VERRRRDVPPTPNVAHVVHVGRSVEHAHIAHVGRSVAHAHIAHVGRSVPPTLLATPWDIYKIRFSHGSAGGPVEILNFLHVAHIAHVGRSVTHAHVAHVGRPRRSVGRAQTFGTLPTSPTSVDQSPPRCSPHCGTYIKIVFRTGGRRPCGNS